MPWTARRRRAGRRCGRRRWRERQRRGLGRRAWGGRVRARAIRVVRDAGRGAVDEQSGRKPRVTRRGDLGSCRLSRWRRAGGVVIASVVRCVCRAGSRSDVAFASGAQKARRARKRRRRAVDQRSRGEGRRTHLPSRARRARTCTTRNRAHRQGHTPMHRLAERGGGGVRSTVVPRVFDALRHTWKMPTSCSSLTGVSTRCVMMGGGFGAGGGGDGLGGEQSDPEHPPP